MGIHNSPLCTVEWLFARLLVHVAPHAPAQGIQTTACALSLGLDMDRLSCAVSQTCLGKEQPYRWPFSFAAAEAARDLAGV